MEKDKDIIEVIIDEQPTNNKKIKFASVSYTHLTLPTNSRV